MMFAILRHQQLIIIENDVFSKSELALWQNWSEIPSFRLKISLTYWIKWIGFEAKSKRRKR